MVQNIQNEMRRLTILFYKIRFLNKSIMQQVNTVFCYIIRYIMLRINNRYYLKSHIKGSIAPSVDISHGSVTQPYKDIIYL